MKVTHILALVASQLGVSCCHEISLESRCSALPSLLNLPDTVIYSTEYIVGGRNISLPDTNVTCLQGPPISSVAVDVCRLTAYAATSDRSGVNFEAWLPANWTGRFISHGNGGLSGCIDYSSLSYSTSYGFAAVSANSGHNGTSGGAFYNNPDVVADFVYRSLHTGVVLGKEITKTFYGRPHTKSYYLGCSTGGRQGFKAVQDYPEDFDGVVAGAPAFFFQGLTAESGYFYTISGPPGAADYISPALWDIVHQGVLDQCDHLDGVVDGIIEDPLRCKPDVDRLLCSCHGANPDACLTRQQALTVKEVFSPVVQTDKSIIYPRYQPGGEGSKLFQNVLANGVPFPYTVDWYRYVIYNDPSWDASKLSKADMAYAFDHDTFDAQTWKGDLSSFRKRGGKVLTYHGQADGLISSENSPRYYQHVSDTMKLKPHELDSFYRFFRIAGMDHCSGGVGAWEIGQTGGAALRDPNANVLTAIVRWVEEGVAPDTILGTKYVNDTRASGVDFQRRHCRFPYHNVYRGKGDAKKPDSWECVLGDQYHTISALPLDFLAGIDAHNHQK